MTKGTIGFQIECAACGTTVIDVPDHAADSTIINCGNGHQLGPYGALKAALNNEAHTAIIGALTNVTFKPI